MTAQVSGGTVSGNITNSSAAPLPNIRVSLTNLQTGLTRTLTTDPRGFYTLPNLAPDTYEMTVSAPGFVTEVRTGVTVTVGAQLVLNVTMQPGNPEKVVRAAAVTASQSSNSGWLGNSPWLPKSSSVRTRPMPNNCAQ